MSWETFLLSLISMLAATLGVGIAVYFTVIYPKKRKAKVQTPLFGDKQIQDWERKFAWKPVQVDGSDWLWLRRYWERKVYHAFDPEVPSQTNFTYQKVTKIEWYLW